MEPQVKQVFQSLPKSAFSGGYYRGGFEAKMTKREAALILGVSPTANKGKIRDAWASLVAQWLRICLPMQGTRVRALVWEDPTCHRAARPVSHNY